MGIRGCLGGGNSREIGENSDIFMLISIPFMLIYANLCQFMIFHGQNIRKIKKYFEFNSQKFRFNMDISA